MMSRFYFRQREPSQAIFLGSICPLKEEATEYLNHCITERNKLSFT